jgi:regulator of sirC expression with transglutaminase-like and TPR domain
VETLKRILSGGDGRLDVAALELAAIEFPGLDPRPSLDTLDRLADGLPLDSLDGLVGYFRELGFRGNRDHYYDPLNSCLNAVLDRRLGIPISLSLVYAEVSRRRGKQLQLLGLPGHFMLGDGARLIDPFNARIYSREQAARVVREVSGVDVLANPSVFDPVTPRDVMQRMLNNLRAIYLEANRLGKAARVLELLRLSLNGTMRDDIDRQLKAVRLRQSRLN